MEITYDKLKVNWDRNGSFILHYINSKNDMCFCKEHLLNVILQQAMHIVRSSESDYWYLAANYDLLNYKMKDIVNTKTFISIPFVVFEAIQSLIRKPESSYITTFPLRDVEVVMDMIITNYNTQVTMLRKDEQYV